MVNISAGRNIGSNFVKLLPQSQSGSSLIAPSSDVKQKAASISLLLLAHRKPDSLIFHRIAASAASCTWFTRNSPEGTHVRSATGTASDSVSQQSCVLVCCVPAWPGSSCHAPDQLDFLQPGPPAVCAIALLLKVLQILVVSAHICNTVWDELFPPFSFIKASQNNYIVDFLIYFSEKCWYLGRIAAAVFQTRTTFSSVLTANTVFCFPGTNLSL